MRPTVSLRARVVVAGTVVVAVVLVLAGLTAYFGVRARLEDNLEELLEERARLAVELAGTVPLEELVEQLSGSAIDVSVDGAGPPGGRPPAVPEFVPGPPSLREAAPTSVRTRQIVFDDGTTVDLAVSTVGVDDALRRLVIVEVVAGAVALVIAVVLLDRAASRALRPLDDVVATAGRITAGGTGERLRPARTDTELGRMAAAFDGMLDELEAALDASRAAEDRSRRFLADAAHQLRTPVAGVAASAEALELAPDEATRRRLARNLEVEAARLGRLVGSLLHLARAEAHPAPACADLAVI